MILSTAHLVKRAVSFLVALMALKTFLEMVAFAFPGEFDQLAVSTETWIPGLDQRQGMILNAGNDSNLDETWSELQDWLHNVPVDYLRYRGGKRARSVSGNCWALPRVWNLNIHNRDWQSLTLNAMASQTLYLFSAHYDDRPQPHPIVRVLSIIDRGHPHSARLTCLLWHRNTSVEEVPVHEKANLFGPNIRMPDATYLLSCESSNPEPPVAVSIVAEETSAGEDEGGGRGGGRCRMPETLIRIRGTDPPPTEQQGTFAVCTRGLLFKNAAYAARFVEWVEMLHMLGAQKFVMYVYELCREIEDLLKYYEARGVIEVIPWSMAGNSAGHSGLQKLTWDNSLFVQMLHDRVAYTDCFYRNMHNFKFVAILDIDEVILPVRHNSWSEMILDMVNRTDDRRTHFLFDNVYFLDDMVDLAREQDEHPDIPAHMHMMHHRRRGKQSAGGLMKSITRTAAGKTFYAHSPTTCLKSPMCYGHLADTESDGYLAHFRKTCQKGIRNCAELVNETLEDTAVLRFKDEMVRRVGRTFRDMGWE